MNVVKTQPFGVVRIRYGKEVGEPAFFRTIWVVLSYIVQQVALVDGSLALLAVGDRRFKILSINIEEDGLARAQIEWLKPEPIVAIPDDLSEIAEAFY